MSIIHDAREEECSFCNGFELLAEADARLADAWVPITIPYRALAAGMVIVGGAKLWHVTSAELHRKGVVVVAAENGAELRSAEMDPDERVPVLYRYVEREAVALLHEQLGATIAKGDAA
jgi:hypothetical protein